SLISAFVSTRRGISEFVSVKLAALVLSITGTGSMSVTVFGEGNWSHTINDWDLLFAQGSAVNALKRVLLSFGEKIEKELQRRISPKQTNDVQ
ncbi:hypothetical protein DBV15_11377, partial [Temnothorax longispinosus]